MGLRNGLQYLQPSKEASLEPHTSPASPLSSKSAASAASTSQSRPFCSPIVSRLPLSPVTKTAPVRRPSCSRIRWLILPSSYPVQQGIWHSRAPLRPEGLPWPPCQPWFLSHLSGHSVTAFAHSSPKGHRAKSPARSHSPGSLPA